MLPSPVTTSEISLEQTLAARRSVRAYRDQALTLPQVAQLLWAAQGITDAAGHRTAPSAGATYPLELYLVAGQVTGLAAGLYRYDPAQHELTLVGAGDLRDDLAAVTGGQGAVKQAPAALVLTAVLERTSWKYHERARRYVDMEVGCASQNALLQAVALGLGTVYVGAFDDATVAQLLQLSPEEEPLAILPVGYPA